MILENPNARVPWYRDVKRLAVVAQIAFLLLVILLIVIIGNNIQTGLKKNGLSFSFGFLTQATSFQVSEGTAFGVPYSSGGEDNYIKVIMVGLYNTLRVSITGVVLATLLGLIVGIARLSSNWLVSRVALVYVEIIRNIPVLVQLIVWYFILILPLFKTVFVFGPIIVFKGLSIPWMVQRDGAANFFPVWLIAFAVGVGVFAWFARIRNRTGVANPAGWYGLLAWAVVVSVAYFALGQPLEASVPTRTNFGPRGGLLLSPEFFALLIGLVVYTSAFIAEIVRAGITAVAKGQWEASRAIGLTYAQTLELVVLPQALRVMIPPLGNQYLNLMKNSSLAVYIGLSDLLSVLYSSGNISGQNVQVFVIAGAMYLLLSLTIAALVNWYNISTKLVTR
jgi:general L-amino acid transport system permease protein